MPPLRKRQKQNEHEKRCGPGRGSKSNSHRDQDPNPLFLGASSELRNYCEGEKLVGLDLFSGIGGLTLALEPWVKPIAYCESDRWAQSLLLSRMRDGSLQVAPIWDDVKTLRREHICTPEIGIDIIYGGFPCQDISVAGAGKGLEGERSGLFFEIVRLTNEIRPPFVFLENVPAIRTRGLREVIRAFTDLRYDCRWTRISAAEVGAPHKRERWFLLAHARSFRLEGLELHQGTQESFAEAVSLSLPKAWAVSDRPTLRMAHELPRPMDEIRALGNAVVPLQAVVAFQRLAGLESGVGEVA